MAAFGLFCQPLKPRRDDALGIEVFQIFNWGCRAVIGNGEGAVVRLKPPGGMPYRYGARNAKVDPLCHYGADLFVASAVSGRCCARSLMSLAEHQCDDSLYGLKLRR